MLQNYHALKTVVAGVLAEPCSTEDTSADILILTHGNDFPFGRSEHLLRYARRGRCEIHPSVIMVRSASSWRVELTVILAH